MNLERMQSYGANRTKSGIFVEVGMENPDFVQTRENR